MKAFRGLSLGIRVLLYCLLSVAVCLPLTGQADPVDQKTREIDAYIRAYADAGTFMGTVLVAKGDKVLLCKGYGQANIDRDIPNGPRTQYRLGSITKGFTAAAVLQLQEKGLLSIDDPVSKYLPNGFQGRGITIRNLLAHTSGLPDYILFPDAFMDMAKPIGLDDLIAQIAGAEPEFQPGQKFRYSNSGFVVLTKVIEAASGKNYADYMKVNIFRPAGMKDSGYYFESRAKAGRRAVGYHYTGEGYVPAPLWDTSRAVGAGAIYSTAEDLFSWSRALKNGKILEESSLALMFEPTPESRNSYGLGWYIRENLGKKRTYHGGYIFGFRSDFSRYPDDPVDIIVLSNVDQAGTRKMAEDLAAILFGTPYEIPKSRKPVKSDTSRYASYAGVYDTSEIFGEGATERVFAEGGRLWYQGSTIYDSLGLPMHIYPESEGKFFDKTGDVLYEFVIGSDGTAEAMLVSDPYESYRFPRLRP